MKAVAEASQPSLDVGARVAGYVIEERIGVGGFGEVFRAKHPVIGREVAIKVLYAKYSADPEAVSRFVAEARAVNKISHAGIVEIYDFGKLDAGREFFVMELLGGRTLRDVLDERGRIPLREAIPLLRGIAEAVDAAHAAGIAHRDLKPDNVFLLDDGRTKLIDFGLAKLMHEEDGLTTRDGSVFGTPMYMSPEQCRGNAVDTRTDLYAFGALAYHMLAGEPPFAGDALELALHHLNDRPVAPSKRNPELPRYVDHVLLSLLAKNPVDRPASLGTAVSALEGSITLRRIRARHVRRLVVVAATSTALGFGAKQLMTKPPEAPSGHARMAAIWNPSIRASIAPRWTGRADIVTTWRLAQHDLDRDTTQWATQWDAATHSPDRERDPLLYAQRLTCLEFAALDLRVYVAVLATIDPTRGWSESAASTLEDCASVDVLRAQVPAPSPEVRPVVDALVLAAAAALVDTSYSAQQRTSMDEGLARLDAIAHALELVHPPSAANPLLMRANILIDTSWDVAARLPRARAALDDAIARIEASRDDYAIALIYASRARFLLTNERDGDVVRAGAQALERAQQASARAGHPRSIERDLHELHGLLEERRQHYDAAVVEYRKAIKQSDPEDINGNFVSHFSIPVALALGGHEQDAIADSGRNVEAVIRLLGDQGVANNARMNLCMVLEYAGELQRALDTHLLTRPKFIDVDAPSYMLAWGTIHDVELALRLGKPDERAILDAVHALANRGTTPARQSPDGLATTRRSGHFDAFAFAAERDLATGTDEAVDAAAYLAFARGDGETAQKLAGQLVTGCAHHPCGDWIRRARWLALRSGPQLDNQLAALDEEYGHDRTALANSAITLAVVGRWADALPRLEAARAIPNVWERQSDLLELDGWLGLARLHAGDVPGARAAFEEALEALSIAYNGFDGFDYMRPVVELALADLLWNAADGDKPRARRLAKRARDGFARLGPHRDAQRTDAEHWLEAHAL